MSEVIQALSTSLSNLVDISCSNDQTTEYVVNILNGYADRIISDPTSLTFEPINHYIPPEQMVLQPAMMAMTPIPMSPLSDDKEKVKKLLAGFDPNNSEAWKAITERFGAQIKQPPLLQMAMMLGDALKIDISRQARRRKSVLIKWFHDNWQSIGKYLDHFKLDGDAMSLTKKIQ